MLLISFSDLLYRVFGHPERGHGNPVLPSGIYVPYNLDEFRGDTIVALCNSRPPQGGYINLCSMTYLLHVYDCYVDCDNPSGAYGDDMVDYFVEFLEDNLSLGQD